MGGCGVESPHVCFSVREYAYLRLFRFFLNMTFLNNVSKSRKSL